MIRYGNPSEPGAEAMLQKRRATVTSPAETGEKSSERSSRGGLRRGMEVPGGGGGKSVERKA